MKNMNKVANFLIFCWTVYYTSAVPFKDIYEYTRLFNDTGEYGVLENKNYQPELDVNVSNSVSKNPTEVQYFLFTRKNQHIPQILDVNDINSILISNFKASRDTIVIAHGWLSNRHTEPNRTLRSVYLDKRDVNVISVDWRQVSYSSYETAVRGVPEVGRNVGHFLNVLNRVTGASFNTIHLMGLSLGAHVVGNAGRELRGRVARVTGFDPAGPSWERNSDRLSSGDGIYVEAIHTDGGPGGMGIGMAIADADFFANDGISQPGCVTSVCRHLRAWQLFAASVTYDHLVGHRCTSTAEIKLDKCLGPTLKMGNDDLNKRGSGMYRVNTGRRYPF